MHVRLVRSALDLRAPWAAGAALHAPGGLCSELGVPAWKRGAGTHRVPSWVPTQFLLSLRLHRGNRGPRESAIWGYTVRQLQCQAHPQASPSLRPVQAAELTHGDWATHPTPRRLRGPSNCRRVSRGSSACSRSHEPRGQLGRQLWPHPGGDTPVSVHRPGQDPKPGLCGPGAWPGLGMGRRAAQDRGGMARVVLATVGKPRGERAS